MLRCAVCNAAIASGYEVRIGGEVFSIHCAKDMNNSRKPPLTDTSPMPFGQFKGIQMGKLPMDYLDFLLRQDWLISWPAVHNYVSQRKEEIVASRPKETTPKNLQTYEEYLRWGRK